MLSFASVLGRSQCGHVPEGHAESMCVPWCVGRGLFTLVVGVVSVHHTYRSLSIVIGAIVIRVWMPVCACLLCGCHLRDCQLVQFMRRACHCATIICAIGSCAISISFVTCAIVICAMFVVMSKQICDCCCDDIVMFCARARARARACAFVVCVMCCSVLRLSK